jgi:hypothetical protein
MPCREDTHKQMHFCCVGFLVHAVMLFNNQRNLQQAKKLLNLEAVESNIS